MMILHHADKAGVDPRMASQDAFARKQYSRKHFSPAHRSAYLGALALGYGLRSLASSSGRRAAARAALATLFGLRRPTVP